MEISSIILISISILCVLCGLYFLFNIELCKEQNSIKEYPNVSIIIPARNEEHNIGKLLASINNQKFKVDELIVVNDSSTDKTKEIAENYGAKVLESMSLPQGWMGKPWACWQGANNAKGDIFLFLDSDTFLEQDGLRKIIDSYVFENELPDSKKGVVISIAPYHKTEKFYEEFSAIFNIIMLGSMNAFTPYKHNQPTGLFGQSLFVSRNNYFEIEGHSSVKNKILENVFMASKFKDKGIKLKCLGGKGTLSFRMYPDGFKALINGWTKAFASGAGQTPIATLLLIIFWLSAGFIIIIKLVFSVLSGSSIIVWLLLYFAFALQMYWMLKRIGTFKLLTALLFPINLLFYVIVFFRSLYYQIFNKTIAWKSREVRN
jgi:4,4'-diaponeurosporenoate glycosyltransferase